MYKRGRGVEKDIEKAKEYLTKSSMQSCGDAQYELGQMYLDGEGVPQDRAEAESLFKDAYLNGHKEAKVILDQEKWAVDLQNVSTPSE